MKRPQSIIKPIAISATEAMKPGVAWVTRMPCALAAATSMLRMSTATRRKAAISGAPARNFRRTGRLPVGHDDLAAARGLRQRLGVEHFAGVVNPHLAQLAQRRERTRAVIIRQHVRDMGEQNGRHGVKLYQGRGAWNPG